MSATYHSLASGPLAQTWSDPALITANDSWTGVPSIEGFLGDIDAGSPTGVDPRTLTGASLGALDVIANQTAPNTLTAGGVAEFAIADPAVALNGSGTADAPSLVLYLDATGQQDVRVRFNVRDLDASADDAVQQVAVQYRIGASGTWTNVAGGYVADATTANAASQVTAVDVTLPADAANQAQVQVRILTTNAAGSDEWVGIDDIQVTSAALGGGGPDTTPPALVSSNPADNATGVATSADIVLTFNDAVQAGTGDITITNGAGDVRTITVGAVDPDGTVTFNGSTATINLAANLAAGTAYDVVVASGAIQDDAGNAFTGITADALDFTTAPAAQTIAIYTIQGAGHVSAFAGQTVTTQGVVTAIDSNGFYIQDATGDGNIATSDGIFVFTSSAPAVTVGHLVSVNGQVSEFTPNGAAPGSLSITEITATAANISDLGVGPTIVATQLGGSAGRKPPTEVLDDDGLAAFDPVHDGIDFYESLEGMLVTVKNPVATGPTSDFGEIYTIVDNDDNPNNGLNATGLTDRGTILVEGGQPAFGDTNTVGGDFNPERIQIDDDSGVLAGFVSPDVNAGARLSDVTGVVGYDFGNYQVAPTQAFTVADPGPLTREVTSVTGSAERLTIASYNVENLDPKVEDINLVAGTTLAQRQANVDDDTAKFTQIASQILNNLRAPDIVALQEVQDNDGAELSAVTSASATLQRLVDTINAAAAATGSSAHYAFQDNPFIGDDLNGGQPGGNIRTA
ncbi:MAG TPA: Ig-like domain-containing protein, partial [Vineibacter sp.]|nr:Ig-like domain-containing protein [Vineibacter sp.]